ncbi:hypothetical protein BDZ97DRAFT_1211068 [Flammula alnicola]|nr:hypothetical protein BDZ97DRAFT_1211068 [Flammula alnicola]
MHHCLQIPEILVSIFELVLNDTWNRKPVLDRQSVLALVKTCRTFNGPALQLLWRNLYTPVPLLLTMTEDLLEVEKEDENSYFTPRTLTFKRDVEANDWERFDFYAPFVKHMGSIERNERSSTNFIVIDDRVCRELELRNRVLLPDLQTMVASSNDLPLTSLLLTPRVHQLQLNMHPSHIMSLSPLTIEIPLRTPLLKSLHLSQSTTWKPPHMALFMDPLFELLNNLDLEEFECDWLPLSDEMTQSLIKMPSLRAMTISKEIPALARILRDDLIKEPRIKVFRVWPHDLGPSYLADILISLRPSQLQEFRIQSQGNMSAHCNSAQLNDLILAISRCCSSIHFTHLSLEGLPWLPSINRGRLAVVTYPMLQPLFRFSNLRNLSLWASPFDLTDAEVKEMAMAWPHLEELYFETTYDTLYPEPRRTTLRCLLWMAIYCRALISLTFPFTGTSSFSDEELALAAGHRLSFLTVGHSVISNPEEVSSFLNTVFPTLSLLMWNDLGGDDANNERWGEVQAQIQQI